MSHGIVNRENLDQPLRENRPVFSAISVPKSSSPRSPPAMDDSLCLPFQHAALRRGNDAMEERSETVLTSLAIIFLCGLVLGYLFSVLKLPGLLGMLTTGIILGPYAMNYLDDSVLLISPDLRQLALVIILTRAGLSIDIRDLKRVGRPAVLMCFVPASFEILGIVLLAPPLVGITRLEVAIMGAVVAAVSPAVVVPHMITLMERGYGKAKSIPQLIMAGASVDDVFVIVLFTSFVALQKGGDFSAMKLGEVPISIVTGAAAGIALGYALSVFFKRFHMRDSVKVIIILGVSLLLLAVEKEFEHVIPFSGLLGVMCIGGGILENYGVLAQRLAGKYSKLWVAAEIILFVLVGATVDINYAVAAGASAVLVIFGALVFRMAGVFVCTMKTGLTMGERIFCMIAYMPKATVQAAIGGIPLAMGLSCGRIVLTVAVLAILITAPLGALGMDLTYAKLLSRGDAAVGQSHGTRGMTRRYRADSQSNP
jgi:NhaP-type Na+/H+ or K+/H+ antiporter